MVPILPLFKLKIVTSDVAITTAAGHRLMGLVLQAGAGAAATIEFNNSDDNSGSDLFSAYQAQGTTSPFIDLTPVGGILFSEGIYADIGGAGAVAYAWWD
jgi:hypothetical protein